MSAFQTIDVQSSYIRKWPYPYRGGMAISNDAEYMSFDFFKTLMTYLNETTDTPLGKGLGIPVTSSVFFYSAHPYNFSYFEGSLVNAAPSAHAPSIIQYIKKGYIDTIHAYGDFDGVGGFERAHADRCFNVLKEHSASLAIFTNHGGVENIQNVGTDAEYHQGDTPEAKAYHADLMSLHGIRYLWTDSMVTQLCNTKKTFLWAWRQLVHNIKITLRGIPKEHPRALLHDVVLEDGHRFKGFMRFRSTGKNAPNLSSLKYQIDQIDWNYFYNNSCGLVLYQHLGVLHRIAGKCYPATIEDLHQHKDLYLSTFRKLKEEKERGDLWLARLIDFLEYVDMAQSSSIETVQDGVYTVASSSLLEHLHGLTIYVDTTKPVIIRYQGQDLTYRVNGPDETGRHSVTIISSKE